MGWFKNVGGVFAKILGFGASPGEEIKKTIGGVTGGLADIRNAFAKEYSAGQKFELEEKLIKMQGLAMEAQNLINLQEAKHPSVFVAGWRPALGWTLTISVFIFFVPQYIMATYIWTTMCLADNVIHPYPVSIWQVIELLMLMLGMGYTVKKRTQEKQLNIHDKH